MNYIKLFEFFSKSKKKEIGYIAKEIPESEIGIDGWNLKQFGKISSKFEEKDEDNNHFSNIYIGDIHEITFIWSNAPFISDYRKENNEYGSANKRIKIGKAIKKYLIGKVSKNRFKEILESEGFDLNIEEGRGYSITLIGRSVIKFFEILKDLKYLV